MKVNKYNKLVLEFFDENKELIINTIKQIIKYYYSIPIVKEDIWSHLIYVFTSVDTETDFYKNKISIEKFIMSRIKFIIFKYCNHYVNNKHKVLNNYISYNDENFNSNFACSIEHYDQKEKFSFLTDLEFQIIYQIKVLKIKRKDIAKQHQISLSNLKNMEYLIMHKIKNAYC